MPHLVIHAPGSAPRRVLLRPGNIFIGRREDVTVRIDDPTVSQLHAMVSVGPQEVWIFDLESKNGTYVNGDRVKSKPLQPGDRIRIGPAELEFHAVERQVAAAAYIPGWLRDMPCWAVSAGLHLVVLLLAGTLVLVEAQAPAGRTTAIVQRQYKAPAFDPTAKRALFRRPKVLGRLKVKKKIIRRLKADRITPDIPKGLSFENLSNKNLAARSLVDVFGLGRGAAGAYGNRIGKGTLVKEGGGEGTEKAVLAALRWLVRHQNPDGRWSSRDWKKRCGKYPGTRGKKCRNKDPKFGDDRGRAGNDIGVTGLALLAFAGTGHTHQFGVRREFVEAVKKGVRYLKSVQVTDPRDPQCGRFGSTTGGHFMYNQALATMALGELLVLTGDTLGLGRTVSYAAQYCIRAQNKGLGWRYGFRPGDNDTSVTGWVVLALKACKTAPITSPTQAEFHRAFRGALKWIDKATDFQQGTTGYQSPTDKREHSVYCMTSVGILCRIFAGQRRSSPVIRKGVEFILKRLPVWKPERRARAKTINMYYWYYGSYALFQYGGKPWRIWNEAMKKALLSSQRVGGCADGSWDPIGQWGPHGGRVYSTALGAMTLEVYYRFVRATGREF